MDHTALSLTQAPPIHLPLRLFLTAPLFVVAAGLVLVVQGDAVLVSRWTPAAIALTHAITIGALGQIMCGALLQILPVIAGAPVPAVRVVGPVVHLGLTIGAALMVHGFMGADSWAIAAGSALAVFGFSVFLPAVALALARAQGVPETLRTLWLAVSALAVTVAIGALLSATLLGWVGLTRLTTWVDIHLSWGLLGWVGLLIMGVGYQVVPMFHVTPPYPKPLTRTLGPAVFIALTLSSALLLAERQIAAAVATGAAGLAFIAFASTTLILQQRRARSGVDATLLHWWAAMAAMLVAPLVWAMHGPHQLVGVLLLIGVGSGLTSGMLLKIVPFLCWFHLQHRQIAAGRLDVRVPHVHRLLPQHLAQLHFAVHGGALTSLLAACYYPSLAPLGGTLLSISAVFLLILLATATWRFQRVARQLADQSGGASPSQPART